MRKLLLVILSLVIVVSLVSCGGGKSGGNAGDKGTVSFNIEVEPTSLDPQVLTDEAGLNVAQFLYESLVRLNEKSEIVPAGAERWDISEDGLKWTFYIRKDMKWSNGDPVTAKDYYNGVKRGLDPELAAEYAYLTYYIKNAQSYSEKKITDFEQVGVKVIDDYTLEFELQDPTAYFGKLLVMPIFYPVNEKALAEFGDQYALDPKKSVYSGPYIMTEWSHGSKVVLERNPNYWTKDKFKIEKLIAVITADLDSAANSYENGELTITKISPEKLKAYKDKPELVSYSDGRVYYFSFNLKNDILKNQKVRQALSLAIDRDKLVNEVLANGSEKGSGIVASGMPGIKDDFRKENGDLYAQYKDEDIKKLFEEGLKELGKTPADVKLSLLIDEQGTAKKEAEFYQAQWREKLGLDVSVDQTTKKDRIARSRSGDYDIVRYSWGPDFADAMTYLELFFSNTEMNIPRYVNPEYDELLSIGRKSNNHDERTEAMEKAEKIVTESFAYSGLYYQTVNILVNSKVKNVHFRSVGAPIDLIDATLD